MRGLLLARDLVDRARFVQGSVTALPFRDRFDLGFCRGVLLFLEPQDIAAAFAELGRSCRTFVLTEPARDRSGQQVDVATLEASIEREDIDQTNWIHPYPRLAVAAGGTIVAEEYVSGNYLMVVEWRDTMP